MNSTPSRTSVGVYFVAILGTFLIMAALVGLMRRYVRPVAPNQTRIEERRKAASEVTVAAQQLESYGVVDGAKGQYQLRVDQAMDMVVRGSRNPAAFRTNLLGRVDKFNAAAAAQPSQFE